MIVEDGPLNLRNTNRNTTLIDRKNSCTKLSNDLWLEPVYVDMARAKHPDRHAGG
jgi:hypothetical protein